MASRNAGGGTPAPSPRSSTESRPVNVNIYVDDPRLAEALKKTIRVEIEDSHDNIMLRMGRDASILQRSNRY